MTNYNVFRNIASRRRVGIWNGGNIVKAKLRGKQDKGWVYFVPNVVEIGFSSPANNMHQLFVGAAYDAPFALLVERERERESYVWWMEHVPFDSLLLGKFKAND